jgi:hypothetical protein
VVVVPLLARSGLAPHEKTSLRHLDRHLSNYDVVAVAAPDIEVELPERYRLIRMDGKFFGSAEAHCHLQLSTELYKPFVDYEYILMYHTDALVFSNELDAWCHSGYDFIGAPWIKSEHTPWVKGEPEVGNSGFALMNVRSFLRVLYSIKRRRTTSELWTAIWGDRNRLKAFRRFIARSLFIDNNVRAHISAMLLLGLPSDFFWSKDAVRYFPEFKIPSGSEALKFAFEVDPSKCYEMNGNKLPFGCHAWERYDRSFWEPHLIPDEE